MNPNEKSVEPYDIFLLSASIFSLYPAIGLLLPNTSREAIDNLIALDWMFSTIFMIDFIVALIQAPNKGQYLKTGWIDFFGSLPALSTFRPLRLIRVIRIVRIMRRIGLRDVVELCLYQPSRSTLWLTATFILFLLIVSSILILQFERSANFSNITNEYDALWWSFVTISTVGYGDHYPITKGGRTLAMILMLAGVSAFGVLTSYLSSMFAESGNQKQEDELKEVSQELMEIKALLYKLENDIQSLKEQRTLEK